MRPNALAMPTRLVFVLLLVALLAPVRAARSAGAAGAAKAVGAAKTAGRDDAYLRSIGLLAGQGLVLAHATVGDLAAMAEKGLAAPRELISRLEACHGYIGLVLADFRDGLTPVLGPEAREDLRMLTAMYEGVGSEIEFLLASFTTGDAKSLSSYSEARARMDAMLKQIAPGGKIP